MSKQQSVLFEWQRSWKEIYIIKKCEEQVPHCPKNNLNLRRKTEPVTAGAAKKR